MIKFTVLFVDDEPYVLLSLERIFRRLRHEYDFHFVESGQSALKFMAEHKVDVIVSDMRMPSMDGATLLAIVQDISPHTIRIMLTGQADQKSVLQTLGTVHQFIAKPTDSEKLQKVIEGFRELHGVLHNEELRTHVSGIGCLPSPPAIIAKLKGQLHAPACTLADIAATIEQDLAMSAKVMQLVNSAFFGRHTNIDSIGKAVNVLGVETIKSLTQSVNVFTEINTDTANLFPVQALWKHSLRVALLAQVIAKTESAPKALVQTAFVAGFMHDIGKLFLATRFQDKYFDTIELAKTQKIPLHQAEQHLLKATHGEVGGYLLGLWGFPDAVVDAAYRHHKNLDYTMENSFSLALAVHVADVLCHGLYPESPLSEPVLNRSPLERASTGRFARWFALSRRMAL